MDLLVRDEVIQVVKELLLLNPKEIKVMGVLQQ